MTTLTPRPATSFRAIEAGYPLKRRLRNVARDLAVFGLSLRSRVPRDSSWLRFPYYHHVFDDERKRFAAQLRYLKNLGDIVSLDDAVAILESDAPIDGRYFCITFDDGFKNNLTNAVPILVDHQVTAAFFVTTGYIGTRPDRDRDLLMGFYGSPNTFIEFMDWDDCRAMVAAGMTIGSHTVNHPRLLSLDGGDVRRELEDSKKEIEAELGTPCEHFCCPTGRPGIDFDTDRDPEIARQLGYRSFLTTQRGANDRKTTPFLLERDHAIAYWGVYQLRYFLSR